MRCNESTSALLLWLALVEYGRFQISVYGVGTLGPCKYAPNEVPLSAEENEIPLSVLLFDGIRFAIFNHEFESSELGGRQRKGRTGATGVFDGKL